jgi:hypothetical protein
MSRATLAASAQRAAVLRKEGPMNEPVNATTADYLRGRAASYRALARRTKSNGLARALRALAAEHEEDAERIAPAETASARSRPPRTRRVRSA